METNVPLDQNIVGSVHAQREANVISVKINSKDGFDVNVSLVRIFDACTSVDKVVGGSVGSGDGLGLQVKVEKGCKEVVVHLA